MSITSCSTCTVCGPGGCRRACPASSPSQRGRGPRRQTKDASGWRLESRKVGVGHKGMRWQRCASVRSHLGRTKSDENSRTNPLRCALLALIRPAKPHLPPGPSKGASKRRSLHHRISEAVSSSRHVRTAHPSVDPAMRLHVGAGVTGHRPAALHMLHLGKVCTSKLGCVARRAPSKQTPNSSSEGNLFSQLHTPATNSRIMIMSSVRGWTNAVAHGCVQSLRMVTYGPIPRRAPPLPSTRAHAHAHGHTHGHRAHHHEIAAVPSFPTHVSVRCCSGC